MDVNDINQFQNILIVGAGELGSAMIKGFLMQRELYPDIQLTVLLREPSSENQRINHRHRLLKIVDRKIKVLTADFCLQTEEELAEIFAAFDSIVNCCGFVGGAGTQLKISKAVLLAGIKRYFPWQFGVDYDCIGMGSGQPVWDEQLAVRNLLRNQDRTQWVIVSTGMFTSFLFESAFGVVDLENRCVNALGDADHALTLTTANDIGMLTAMIFFNDPLIKNQVIYIAGDTVTYRKLKDLLGKHYNTIFSLNVYDVPFLKARVAQSPHDVYAKYCLAFARRDGVAWKKSETYNAKNNIPVTDIQKWLFENDPLKPKS